VFLRLNLLPLQVEQAAGTVQRVDGLIVEADNLGRVPEQHALHDPD
jgi:hypothetical protein